MDKKLLMNLEAPLGKTNLEIIRRKLYAGRTIPVHWHDYCELEIILSGKAIHVMNGTEYELSRGSMYMLSFYDYHAFTALEETEMINLNFSRDLLDARISDYLENSGKAIVCSLSEEELEYIDGRVTALENENSPEIYMGDVVISSLLSEILARAIRKTNEAGKAALPPLVQQATAYIHTNFRRDISLDILAEALCVSSGYLGKLLKKSLNKSFNDYLGSVRLKYACNLLESSEMSVGDIAFAAGYNSVPYFLYVFKKKFGITPGEYKQLKDSCSKDLKTRILNKGR